MANGHGGPRTPRNPAPASGPGRLSRRVDGGPGQKLQVASGMPYGQRQATLNQERSGAMSQADPTPQVNIPAAQAPQQGAGYQGGPFDAPTARPDEPVTTGADAGPGPGPEILPLEMQPQFNNQGPMTQMLAQLSAQDVSGAIANLYQSALSLGA